MAIIEFHEVSKSYASTPTRRFALADVSLSIEEAEFALLLGPSGAGKSTLLKLILAIEQPDRGIISVAGRNIARLVRSSIPYLRRNVGSVFQNFMLLGEATPLENVLLALQVLGVRSRDARIRARESLSQVDLDPDLRHPVRCLSGGEQQRVAIARALAGDPAILLADEPTGNLDPKLTHDILDLLGSISRMGTTVLIATHDPLVCAHAAATRVFRLQAGRVSQSEGMLPGGVDDSTADIEAVA